MATHRLLDLTFKKHLQTVHYANDMVDDEVIRNIMSKFEILSTVIHYSCPLLYVLDYTKSQYHMMTKGIQLMSDHDPQAFLEGGIPMIIDIFHKDDFRVYNESIFSANMKFLQNQPQSDHHKFIFSWNYRIRHKNGNYFPIMQNGSYITSEETGLPLFCLGLAFDISHFKKDRIMYHNIERVDESNGIITKQAVINNYFYPYEEDKILSIQEKNVLGYMADGFSSKQIAYKLRISINTIANHRANMLKKTNTKNVAELVAFACKSQII